MWEGEGGGVGKCGILMEFVVVDHSALDVTRIINLKKYFLLE